MYNGAQIVNILDSLGIRRAGETVSDVQAYCPFHYNTYSPAFSISKTTGKFICFSPQCGEKGDVLKLIKDVGGYNDFQAMRLVNKFKSEDISLDLSLDEEPEYPEFDARIAETWQKVFWGSEAHEYMNNRGYSDDTLRYFGIGYDAQRQMVANPLHSPYGKIMGFILRSVERKQFLTTDNIQRSKSLYNLHNAKRHSAVVVVEAGFDAMKVHQAGYPNVVATTGPLSQHQVALLDRYFSRIIIMTDFDDKEANRWSGCRKCDGPCQGHNPGRDMGMKIAKQLRHKEIYWACYSYTEVYPRGAKDAGDLTSEEISACIDNAVDNFEYKTLGLY